MMWSCMLLKVWAFVVVGSVVLVLGVEDSFSSMNSMQSLISTEKKLIDILQAVIKEENARLVKLTRYLSNMVAAHHEAAIDPENYVLNPLNAFHLMKRLTIDSQEIERLIMEPVANLQEIKQDLDLPVMDDMDGTAEALCRLQDTYKLSARDLAEGVINGIKYSQTMSANDAWEIGRRMYDINDHYHANLWLKLALELHDEELEERPLKPTNRSLMLDYRAYSVYVLGNVKKALHLTQEYLELMPNCTRNKNNVKIYKMELNDKNVKEVGDEVEKERPKSFFWDEVVQKKYEKLCRGEVEVNHALVCRYTDRGNPYFRVGKVKMEEVSLDPQVLVFYDVIYDGEIEVIKGLARPIITRSLVANFTVKEVKEWKDRTRVSQTAFLDEELHEVIKTVDRRAGMLANLNHLSSESLQVLNYGIGGHYEPHYDFSESTAPDRGFANFLGNRIATLLYYMSDVEQGGATAFPEAGTAVFPRKGSAVLWYNLFRDGEVDYRTRHGACSVLIGSKWACNKWFHEGMQEFLRPCTLEQDSLQFKNPQIVKAIEDDISEDEDVCVLDQQGPDAGKCNKQLYSDADDTITSDKMGLLEPEELDYHTGEHGFNHLVGDYDGNDDGNDFSYEDFSNLLDRNY